jgi:predicted ATPase
LAIPAGRPRRWTPAHRLVGLDVPAHVEAAVAAFPYRATVFIAPPWPAIYRTDAERRESLDEAERTHEVIVESYTRYGYRLVELPRAEPAERLRFVIRDLSPPA